MGDEGRDSNASGDNTNNDKLEINFGFPILDVTPNLNMKNIPPSILPHFHGLVTEDPDSFLFEFDILCRSYNYINDAQK